MAKNISRSRASACAAAQMTFPDSVIGDEIDDSNSGYLSEQILTYIGNKRSLLEHIGRCMQIVRTRLSKDKLVFFDAFAGSGIVSRYMKQYSSQIITNDLERYSEIVNDCYLTNLEEIDVAEFDEVFRAWVDYTKTHLRAGIIASNYAPQDDLNIKMGERVFYTRQNAILLDSARNALDIVVPKKYFNLLCGPLLAEASIHPNTSGVFKGFYKGRNGIGAFGGEGRNALTRICGEIMLQKPILSKHSCGRKIFRGDTNEIVKQIKSVDVTYLDPPYNQHPYGSNYFMLNILADNHISAEISDVSGIPSDWNHSKYNKKCCAEKTFFALLTAIPSKFLVISYNSEGFIPKDHFMHFLNSIGTVTPFEILYNTFRGSRNLRERPLKVTEYLFLVERK